METVIAIKILYVIWSGPADDHLDHHSKTLHPLFSRPECESFIPGFGGNNNAILTLNLNWSSQCQGWVHSSTDINKCVVIKIDYTFEVRFRISITNLHDG